ncbi:LrgB family protein [Deinococcus cellulosilyticus]|uniref:Murein hydrolase transporter LrgB n=1 Tax=Deinococcus cellulosilyticus (strain DSM 18568 / NBRC 106333 / KACC 11606 / 5516J-15) TaxID=1223518 RepID=A0A511N498_DEIC1|nr:LrgB family protein [Deinococcus cellulosilyticus]GEM47655.1 murein hydrolase transporter LrgB [Deinococcus cellulosilyticus NBRC 106333 = KACC 11606]
MTEVSLLITLIGFLLGMELQKRFPHPLVNPTLISILGVALYLGLTHVPYAQYRLHTEALQFLLGPAVVALAVPLYQQRDLLKAHLMSILLGFLTGGLTVLLVSFWLGKLLDLPPEAHLSLSTMSSTSPISLAVAQKLGFSGSLSAMVSIWTGILGALLLPPWLTRLGVRSPLLRGLTLGTLSHGIGTARMVQEGAVSTAASSLGMGLNGALTALLMPLVWHWLR